MKDRVGLKSRKYLVFVTVCSENISKYLRKYKSIKIVCKDVNRQDK